MGRKANLLPAYDDLAKDVRGAGQAEDLNRAEAVTVALA
jgi:hypothetical protein